MHCPSPYDDSDCFKTQKKPKRANKRTIPSMELTERDHFYDHTRSIRRVETCDVTTVVFQGLHWGRFVWVLFCCARSIWHHWFCSYVVSSEETQQLETRTEAIVLAITDKVLGKATVHSTTWYIVCCIYRVIHKSLRDFRLSPYSSRDGHAEREHVNRGRDTPSFCPTLQVLDMSAFGDAADVNLVIKFLPLVV